jgi:hypothetical protein
MVFACHIVSLRNEKVEVMWPYRLPAGIAVAMVLPSLYFMPRQPGGDTQQKKRE